MSSCFDSTVVKGLHFHVQNRAKWDPHKLHRWCGARFSRALTALPGGLKRRMSCGKIMFISISKESNPKPCGRRGNDWHTSCKTSSLGAVMTLRSLRSLNISESITYSYSYLSDETWASTILDIPWFANGRLWKTGLKSKGICSYPRHDVTSNFVGVFHVSSYNIFSICVKKNYLFTSFCEFVTRAPGVATPFSLATKGQHHPTSKSNSSDLSPWPARTSGPTAAAAASQRNSPVA